jgi:hypothetical protein
MGLGNCQVLLYTIWLSVIVEPRRVGLASHVVQGMLSLWDYNTCSHVVKSCSATQTTALPSSALPSTAKKSSARPLLPSPSPLGQAPQCTHTPDHPILCPQTQPGPGLLPGTLITQSSR